MLNRNEATLFKLIARENPNIFVVSVIFGIISGIGYALVFPIILYSLAPQSLLLPELGEGDLYSFFHSPKSEIAKLFVYVCIVIFITKLLTSVGNSYLSNKMSVSLRTSLYHQISNSSIESVERLGYEKLITVLNVDVINVVVGATVIPGILTSSATIFGLLVYLSYLNVNALFHVLIFLLVGVISFQAFSFFGGKYLKRSRSIFDKVQDGIRGLVFGAKELKLNSLKSEIHFAKSLEENERLALKNHLAGMSILLFATSYSELMVFILIGLAAFHLSYVYFIDSVDLVGIVMALLYISGPVGLVLNAIPQILRGNVALNSIHDVAEKLEQENVNKSGSPKIHWNNYSLRNVKYEYVNEAGDAFGIKNINLEMHRGELIFIVGGNGSGKSTLAKVLSMHYVPQEGACLLGGVTLNWESLHSARQLVGTVFTDFHLFRWMYGYQLESKCEVLSYLKYLGLEGKVSVSDTGEFSTTQLSDGQRKRLALLCSLMEDKEIYIFDEWAADQDPIFKKVFYEVILPDLKGQGKLVVAITHDDSYFHLADTVVFMDYGEISRIENRSQKSMVM